MVVIIYASSVVSSLVQKRSSSGDPIKEAETENGRMMERWNGEMPERRKLTRNPVKDGTAENHPWMVPEFVYVPGWLLGAATHKF